MEKILKEIAQYMVAIVQTIKQTQTQNNQIIKLLTEIKDGNIRP